MRIGTEIKKDWNRPFFGNSSIFCFWTSTFFKVELFFNQLKNRMLDFKNSIFFHFIATSILLGESVATLLTHRNGIPISGIDKASKQQGRGGNARTFQNNTNPLSWLIFSLPKQGNVVLSYSPFYTIKLPVISINESPVFSWAPGFFLMC
jgi:hypothetical protein